MKDPADNGTFDASGPAETGGTSSKSTVQDTESVVQKISTATEPLDTELSKLVKSSSLPDANSFEKGTQKSPVSGSEHCEIPVDEARGYSSADAATEKLLHTMADVTEISSDSDDTGIMERRLQGCSDALDHLVSTNEHNCMVVGTYGISSDNPDLPTAAKIVSHDDSGSQDSDAAEDSILEQLDSALRLHDDGVDVAIQRTGTIVKSLPPDTGSSASITGSSEDFKQTIISKAESSVNPVLEKTSGVGSSLNQSAPITEESHPVQRYGSPGEVRAQSLTPTKLILPADLPQTPQTVVSTDSLTSNTATLTEEHLSADVPGVQQDTEVKQDRRTPLLSKVVLIPDTPDTKTTQDGMEGHGSYILPGQVIGAATAVAIQSAAKSDKSPGRTSNALLVPTDNGKLSVDKQVEGLLEGGSQSKETSPQNDSSSRTAAVHGDGNQSEEITKFYTTSTELANYMAASMDTIPSSLSTLPYAPQLSQGSPSPRRKDDTNPLPLVRRSYTLDEPSPALLNSAKANRSRNADGEHGGPATEVVSAPLTSSMEDLKMRPAQRRLDYSEKQNSDSTQGDEKPLETNHTGPIPSDKSPVLPPVDAESDGKYEHLRRYLHHISQMPRPHLLPDPQMELTSDPTQSEVIAMAANECDSPSHNTWAGVAARTTVSDVASHAPVQQVDNDNGSTAHPTYFPSPYAVNSKRCSDINHVGHNISKSDNRIPEDKGLVPEAAAPDSEPVDHEEFLQAQLRYFDTMRQDLMQQQQRQLSQLLQQQEQQQAALQEELMSLLSTSNTSQTDASLNSESSKQQRSQAKGNTSATGGRKSQELKRQQLFKTNQRHNKPQHSGHKDTSLTTVNKFPLPDSSFFPPLDDPTTRPYSAPVPKVSFALDDALSASESGQYSSPSGVYCNQSFPHNQQSSQTEVYETSPHTAQQAWPSPSVLHKNSTSSTPTSHSGTPPSILKTSPRSQDSPPYTRAGGKARPKFSPGQVLVIKPLIISYNSFSYNER